MLSLALVACNVEPPATVVIDGPAEVRVDALGPVPLPRVSVRQGAEEIDAGDVVWTVDPAGVATVSGDHLDVEGVGTVTVTAAAPSHGADVRGSFTLISAAPVVLTFAAPPATLAVGATVQLVTVTTVGGRPSIVESVPTFASSNDAFATVTPAGALTGRAPGVVYITGRLGTSEAMAEIEVQ